MGYMDTVTRPAPPVGGFDMMTQADMARRQAALESVMSMPLSAVRAKTDMQRGEQFKGDIGRAAVGMWSPVPGGPGGPPGGAPPSPGAMPGQPAGPPIAAALGPPGGGMMAGPSAGTPGEEPELSIMTEREFALQNYPEVAGKPLIARKLRAEIRQQYGDYVQRTQLLFGAQRDRQRYQHKLAAEAAKGQDLPRNVEELLTRSLSGEAYDPAAVTTAQSMFDQKHPAPGRGSPPSSMEALLARGLMDPTSVPPEAMKQAGAFLEKGKARQQSAEEQAELAAYEEIKNNPGTAVEKLQKLVQASSRGGGDDLRLVTSGVVNEMLFGDGVLKQGLVNDFKTAREEGDASGVVKSWEAMGEWHRVSAQLEPKAAKRLEGVVQQFRPSAEEVKAAYDAGAFGPPKTTYMGLGSSEQDVAETNRRFYEFMKRWGDPETVARFQAMATDGDEDGVYQGAGLQHSN